MCIFVFLKKPWKDMQQWGGRVKLKFHHIPILFSVSKIFYNNQALSM